MEKTENFEKLNRFFEANLRIKEAIATSAPPGIFQYFDEEKYSNKLEENIKFIFSELRNIVKDFFGQASIFYLKVQQLEVDTKHEFYKCGLDKKKLREFYNNFISYMSPEFVALVKESCVGYTIDNRKYDPMDKFTTVNELLHYLHCYIMNSNFLYQSIPLISEKKNFFNYPITYRGTKTEMFDSIYENFPLDLDVGHTDLISLNDKKLLMMVRDRGHALTIELTIKGNIARFEYFIPKLCNVDMINSLPGVNKVKENSRVGTTGVFEIPVQGLPYMVYDFISRVPMDKDMPSIQAWKVGK